MNLKYDGVPIPELSFTVDATCDFNGVEVSPPKTLFWRGYVVNWPEQSNADGADASMD